MLILNDEKITSKIKKVDSNFNNNYTYCVLKNESNKFSNIIPWIFLFITIFTISFICDVFFNVTMPLEIAIFIGALFGVLISFQNKPCIITIENKELKLYIFNLIMTKVTNSVTVPYSELKINKFKKRPTWYTIHTTINNQKTKIIISTKVLGLKHQQENSTAFINKIKNI